MTHNLKTLDAESLAKIISSIRLVAFDFDGVFIDNSVFVFEDGREAVRCMRSDGLGIGKLKALGLSVVVVSTEVNPVVQARSRNSSSNASTGATISSPSSTSSPLTQVSRSTRLRLSGTM